MRSGSWGYWKTEKDKNIDRYGGKVIGGVHRDADGYAWKYNALKPEEGEGGAKDVPTKPRGGEEKRRIESWNILKGRREKRVCLRSLQKNG